MNKTFKTILIYVILPALIGFAGAAGMYAYADYEEKTEISEKLTDYTERFVNLITDLEMKQKADTTGDRILNTYILRTFGLHQEVYRYTVEKRLLDKDDALFQTSLQVMKAIHNWQMTTEKSRQNLLSGMGLSELYVIEMEEQKTLIDDYTVQTCKEVLKIDPANKQAEETLRNVYSNRTE